MPLDSSIPLMAQSANFETPQNQLMASLRTKALQGQVDQQQQQYGRQNALMSVLQQPGTFGADGSFNRTAIPQIAAADPESVGKWTATANAQDQSAAARRKAQIDGALQKMEVVGQFMGQVKDQGSYEQAIQGIAGVLGPDAISGISPTYNPDVVNQKRAQAMSMKQQLEQQKLQFNQNIDTQKLNLDTRKQDFTEGQNKYSSAGDGTVFNTQTGLGPDGAPLQPKDKGLNDGQAKANLFGSRAAESDRILEQLSSQGVDRPSMIKGAAESVPFIGGALGTVANAVAASPQQQQVEQAQRDFVNSVLRRESGAAIAPSEFDNAKKQYFPSIGDAPEVIAQKAANRKLAIKGIMAEVPAAFQAKQGGQSGAGAGKTITRRGTAPDGRTVVQYSDGTTGYQ